MPRWRLSRAAERPLLGTWTLASTWVLAVMTCLVARPAHAAGEGPADGAEPTGAAEAAAGDDEGGQAGADSVEAKKAAAITSLERGLELFQLKQYEAALAEFLRSRRLYAARGNTLNAALALRELGRYDEALAMFETLLRDFPKISAAQKKQVQSALVEMRKRVGTVEILVDEPGAKVVIAGRERGTTPLSHPIRVSVGGHLVRIVKEGFAPLEVRVDVAGGEHVPVEGRLHGLTKSGKLKVVERSGAPATVLVDNIEVGTTPWEGRLAIGPHTVMLRGEGDSGTQPAAATVRLHQSVALTLELEELGCALRVQPTPAGAAIALDGVALGNGLWEGRLRCGSHRLEVAQEGFLSARRDVTLVAARPGHVDIALNRDPESELWAEKNPPRVAIDLSLAPAFSWSLGGDVADGCGDGCDADVPIGLVASLVGGYQFSFGLGLGVNVGYGRIEQNTSNRPIQATQVPVGTALAGTMDDELLLQGALLGGSLWFRRGAEWPLTARVNGGIFLGSMQTLRTARLAGVEWALPEASLDARYVYVNPEVRIGYALNQYLDLSLVLQSHFLIAVDKPSWQQEGDYYYESVGFVDFQPESLTSDVVVLITPGLGAALSFY